MKKFRMAQLSVITLALVATTLSSLPANAAGHESLRIIDSLGQAPGSSLATPYINGKANIPYPAVGELVYDTSDSTFYGRDHSGNWLTLSGGSSSALVSARYTSASGQSIPHTTGTIVDFGTMDYDTDSAVTTGASWKFTAPSNGKYFVTAKVAFASNSTSSRVIYIHKNGTLYSRAYTQPVSNGDPTTPQISDVVTLTAGDYIDVRVLQQTGGSLALINNGVDNTISITKIGN